MASADVIKSRAYIDCPFIPISLPFSPPCEAQREGVSSLLAPSPPGEGWGEGRDAARPPRKSNDSPRDITAGTRALAPPNTSGYFGGSQWRRPLTPALSRGRGSQFFRASTAPVLKQGLWPPWPLSEKPIPVSPLTSSSQGGKGIARSRQNPIAHNRKFAGLVASSSWVRFLY